MQEGEDHSDQEEKIRTLIGEARKLHPNWKTADLREQINALMLRFDDFSVVAQVVTDTANDKTTGMPSRITASRNPHLLKVTGTPRRGTLDPATVAALDAMPDGAVTSPDAHEFQADHSGVSCGSLLRNGVPCGMPRAHGRHRIPKPRNQAWPGDGWDPLRNAARSSDPSTWGIAAA